ncbi:MULTISPECIES: DUF418 domain-containing protein [Bacillota]|uniref:DUF418 domain-containing protein n=1 Tax=Bacillota TaxID=1239 RepID=UPI0039F09567
MIRRIEALDIIRGLSIIGILFVNIHSFSWPEIYDSNPSEYWSLPFNHVVHDFLFVLFQSSFYPIFALLFGVSMTFIFKGAEKRGLNPYRIYTKRLIFLLGIGAFHAFFIWYGDILIIYALLGLVLLLFYRLKANTLLSLGVVLWLVPNSLYGLYLYISQTALVPYDNSLVIRTVTNAYQSGFWKIVAQNMEDWNQLYNLYSIPFIFVSIFPMFILGLAVAKKNWHVSIGGTSEQIKKTWIAAGVLGLFFKILPIFEPNNLLYAHIAEAFGGPLLGLFYALCITRCSPSGSYIEGIAAVGRMSMTNYLLQSILGFIIYKIGGLYGQLPPLVNLLVAMVIIAFQLTISAFWMKRFKSGPVELLWKKFTYGSTGGQVKKSKVALEYSEGS